ncbi:complement C1q subcomponent subunit B-like [Mercenaria mercenaria]|uniref:complement C1q subcomponent subunit B-like n=1 Tax=Mercenaria mercenaria TaxID=6596 RepID=UPI00234E3B45|nr:complement C1q subcomponent subunit B-like [Mercenaria mercenaria]XP_045170115.2 complement C1q subcomponent subunit B-like [Mercenaria mercenaria]
MEQYCKLAMMLLVLWAVSCHGQHVPDLTVGQLHSQVRELEGTVQQLLKLLDMQNLQTKSTKAATPAMEKRGFMYPGVSVYPSDVSTPVDEIGFHVSLTDDVRLDWGMKLPFDTIVENMGEAYNKAAAEFTCPISGTYLFSLNIACKKDSYVEVSVEINNGKSPPRYILNTVCDHRKRPLLGVSSLYCGNTQNGGTAIVSLAQDETVTVKKMWPVGGVSTIIGNGFSTFSGYLLRPS